MSAAVSAVRWPTCVLCATFGLLGALGGCASEPAQPSPEFAVDARPSLVWQAAGAYAVQAARTATITIDVPDNARFVAIRVTPVWLDLAPTQRTVCYQLDKVAPQTGPRWVKDSRVGRDWGPACRECSHRTSSQPGYGAFVLPNNGQPLGSPGTLTLRVVLRDCATGVAADTGLNPDLPDRVALNYATEPEVSDAAVGELRVRLAFADGTMVSDDKLDARWTAATQRAKSLLLGASVRTVVERIVATPRHQGDLRYGNGNFPATDAAIKAVRELAARGANPDTERYVLAVVVPCVMHSPATNSALLGASLRVPGGLRWHDVADAVVLAPTVCDTAKGALSAHDLGTLIAHELGHYLGLYHSDEVWADHRALAQPDDIMRSNAVLSGGELSFSAAQKEVIRRHPVVWYAP